MPKGAIPFPFGQCRVCNAPATGKHYGANTCEGCKGFFKRSLIKYEKYRCLGNDKCEIDPENRIKCKLCRFRRCLELGMSMEAIKMGRIPKVEKQKALEENRRASTDDGVDANGGDSYKKHSRSSSPPVTDYIQPPKPKKPKTSVHRINTGQVHPMGRQNSQAHLRTQAPEYFKANSVQEEPHDMVQLLNDVMLMNECADSRSSVAAVVPFTATSTPSPSDHLHSEHLHSDHLHSGHSVAVDHPSTIRNAAADYGHVNRFDGWHPIPTSQQYSTNHLPAGQYQSMHRNDTQTRYPQHKNEYSPHDYNLTFDGYQAPGSNHFSDPSFSLHTSVTPHGGNVTSCSSVIRHDLDRSMSVDSSAGNGSRASTADGSHDSMAVVVHSSVTGSENTHQYLKSCNESSVGKMQTSSSSLSYDCATISSQQYCSNQNELHSDYGSVEDLRAGYHGSPNEKMEEFIKSVARIYWDVTADVREGINIMEEIIATGSTDRLIPYCTGNLDTVWKYLMESVTNYNNLMTKFCLKCPLLSNVCADDKKVVIEHSYMSLWLIWNSPLFKNGETYIPFLNKYIYNRGWMERILPSDFVEYLHEYTGRQNAARFSINETALLCGLALTIDNVAGVKNPEILHQYHQEFHKAITYEICKNRVNSKEMLNEIPQLLKHLEIAVEKQKIILSFNDRNPPDIKF